MISAESAIRGLRRDLTLSSILKAALLGAGMAALLAGPIYGSAWSSTAAVIAIAALWVLLSYRSALRSHAAADSPLLIASGQFDEAEQRIEGVLRGDSRFSAPPNCSAFIICRFCGTPSTGGGNRLCSAKRFSASDWVLCRRWPIPVD